MDPYDDEYEKMHSNEHIQNLRPNATSRFLVIGAGSRGNAYARALLNATPDAQITAVAEPIELKRRAFGQKYIWGNAKPVPHQYFDDWRAFLKWDHRWHKETEGEQLTRSGVEAIFICTLDETHVEIITAFAGCGYHIMSEKPLATTLQDCLRIYRSLQPPRTDQQTIFSIGHVLHYSPHNMLLRKLLLEEEVIGDILSIEHTEPVGWWHFSHSYVRGNWRKQSKTAPSLLTKSCHDIDLLLWLLCSPPVSANQKPHLPSDVSSTGSLLYFKKSRKPDKAGRATNCYSCNAEFDCLYSAKKIYMRDQLLQGNPGWPVNIVESEVEDMYIRGEIDAASQRLEERLREDYISSDMGANNRPWYGRCVYEANNDVCDDQVVTISWEEDPLAPEECSSEEQRIHGRGAMTATFHMVAYTEKQCERRGRIYGTKGEITYDSKTIRVYDFASKQAQTHHPQQPVGGHGGGDAGLALAFFNAVQAVNLQGSTVREAQRLHIGCTIEDIIRSHAMVFAAEEARTEKKVVSWPGWWQSNVETYMAESGA